MTADTSDTDILILGQAPQAREWLRALPCLVRDTTEAQLAAEQPWHGVRLILCAPAADPALLAGLRVLPALQDSAMVALSPACDDGRVEFDDVIDLAASTAEAFAARILATVNGARVRARRNARYRLLQQVDDTFRHLDDPRDIALAAAGLLGRHLRVNRCAFADVEADEDTFNLTGDYTAGVPSIVGRYRFAQFGAACLAAMRRGEPWVVEDAMADPRVGAAGASYGATHIRAVICVPVRKDDRFVAAMAVHAVTPRRWRTDEVSLLVAVAERSWESIERGRIARTLQAKEARYRTLVETMSAVVWHMDGDRMRAGENPSWSAFTGQLPEEYEGFGWMDALHPQDRAAAAAAWQSAATHGHPYVASYRLRRHDGEYRHMLSRGAAVRACATAVEWVGNCLDVTDIRHAQEALRVANTRLQFTLDSAQIADFVYDPARRRIGGTGRLARLLDCEAEDGEWEVDAVAARIHPDDLPRLAGSFRAAMDGNRPWRDECRLLGADGKERWVATHGSRYSDDGNGWRLLGIVYDITAHKRSEQALREADARKDEFLAMLAHELRNPLAPIGAAAQVLAVAGIDPARTAMASAVIGRQVKHMAGLVDDLLDVSRVKRGLVRLEKRRCDMATVIAAAVEQVRPMVDRRGHQLSVALPDTAVFVGGDEKRLVQVAANLLNNAAKYTPDRGRIDVSLDVTGGTAVVTVRDNGVGMSADFLERAFDVFAQADQSIARSQGGLGLGLPLARSLVTAHGGAIECASEGPGRGATFRVALPLASG
ncbi:ATP-binding protein [Massilia sp. METH4]|uniref:sensor histidine kinase n=1 Tax=Massilia sp. METH4 TaxID=3123041 RepID=UPI0030CC9700